MSSAPLYDTIGATYTAGAARNRDLLDLDAAELGARLLVA
jgi:hypothetical protein